MYGDNPGMDKASVDSWFAAYFTDFVAIGRGDADPRLLLGHYAVPLLLSMDGTAVQLTDEAQVLGMFQQQFDSMRAEGFDRTDQVGSETEILNDTCALHRGRFVRRRADGSEINSFTSSYLIAALPEGPRITALVVHST